MTQRNVDAEVEALNGLDLKGVRAVWRSRFGAPPKLRSVELLRLLLAWRLQAELHGGLDADLRRQLRDRRRIRMERLNLVVGTRLRREWQGRTVEVVVAEDGFHWNGKAHRSLSAVATAIAGSRWNGPRFFGMRQARS